MLDRRRTRHLAVLGILGALLTGWLALRGGIEASSGAPVVGREVARIEPTPMVPQPAAQPERSARSAPPEVTPRTAPRPAQDPGPLPTAEPEGRPLWGRVVAAEDGSPLFGVEVRRRRERPGMRPQLLVNPRKELAAVSNADGLFMLREGAQRDELAVLTLSGRGPALVPIRSLPAESEQPFLVRLPLAAALVGRVDSLEPGLGLVQVVVRAEGYELVQGQVLIMDTVEWAASIESDGTYSLRDLPPSVSLKLSLRNARKTFERQRIEPLTLEPGEERPLDWSASDIGRVHGIVREADGTPSAGLELWLLPASEVGLSFLKRYAAPTRKAVTGADGRFELADVPAGAWVIGPQPTAQEDEDVPPRAPAPLATPIEVPSGGDAPFVELVVHRGLDIRGRVLGPDGEGAANALLTAICYEADVRLFGGTRPDGTFALGPLVPGHYRIDARPMKGLYAAAPPTWAYDGDRDVELHLTRGGQLAGKVIDGQSGVETTAQVSVQSSERSGLRTQFDRSDFTFSALLPGRYHVVASTDDGRIGVLRDQVVSAGSALEGLEVRVARGGWVEVHYRGPKEYARMLLEQDGVTYADDSVRSGASARHPSPTGTVVARLSLRGSPGAPDREAERTIEVARGEVNVVEIAFDD